MKVEGTIRARLMRALHAEGSKRGLDHDGIRDICHLKFNVDSMGALNEGQLKTLFRDWTGRNFTRRKTALPKRGYAKSGELEMVSAEDLETLERAFSARQWGPETKRAFIRRQLDGREEIRTKADFHRVFSGARAMNRRDGK
jgi:hypothetical protein